MRFPHSYFRLEAIWILAFSLVPLLTGLLIALLVRALR